MVKKQRHNPRTYVSARPRNPREAGRLCPLMVMPLLFGGAVEAFAQGGGHVAALEEVVVTANRRQETVQEVPVSVTAISGEQLSAQGITNFQDIKAATPGLYLEKPSNIGDSSVRLRGVGSTPNSGVDSSVGVLVDGVYQIQPGAAFTELLDIEQVEVLRGPQGTLFGRNTTAGVVHIHTKDPNTYETSGKVQGVLGNFNQRELRGVLNLPLIADTLAVRLSGFTGKRDGYTDNVHLDKDTRNDDRHGGRIKLLWNATDDLELKWSSERLVTEGDLDSGLVTYGVDNITNLPAWRNRPWQDLASALGTTLPTPELGKSRENVGAYKDEVERHVLTATWSLSDELSLQSITAHDRISSWLIKDRDRTPLELSYLTSAPVRKAWSEELILTGETSGPISYVAGLFWQTEELDSPTTIHNSADLFRLSPTASQIPTISRTTRDNETRALFGSVTYDLTDDWSLVGGIRYTSDKKQTYSTLQISPTMTAVAIDDDDTFNEWTYSAKAQYRIDPDKMAYLSVDRGFKSGGFNRQNTTCSLTGGAMGCLDADLLTYDPETTDSVELGLKSVWLDGRLRLNAALFYQVYDDFQVSQALFGESSTIISNAAKVESKGIEFDFGAALTESLTLEGGIGYIDSGYDEFASAPCPAPGYPGCVGNTQDLSGSRLDNAPLWTGSAALTYRAPTPFNDSLTWFARIDTSLKSGVNLDVTQPYETRQGGYALYGARVGLEPLDASWTLTLWGSNLTDKEYSSTGQLDAGGVARIQGMPRTYGMTVDWNF